MISVCGHLTNSGRVTAEFTRMTITHAKLRLRTTRRVRYRSLQFPQEWLQPPCAFRRTIDRGRLRLNSTDGHRRGEVCEITAKTLKRPMSKPPPTRPSLLVRLRDPGDDLAWSEFVEIYTPLICELRLNVFLARAGPVFFRPVIHGQPEGLAYKLGQVLHRNRSVDRTASW